MNKDDFSFVRLEEEIFDSKMEGKPIGFLKDATIRFSKKKVALFAACVLFFFIVMAIFGPSINPFTYREQKIAHSLLPPRVPLLEKLQLGVLDGTQTVRVRKENLQSTYGDTVIKVLRESTMEYKGNSYAMVEARVDMYRFKGADDVYYWFGSDELGRDLWTRLWRGTRISLMLAFGTTIINVLIGVIYGSISGYYGGKIDMAMQRVIEVLGALPNTPLLILCILYFGASVTTFLIAFCLTGWIGYSRMTRGQFYRFKNMEYVLASRTMGASDISLIFKHILPNAIGPLITSAALAIPRVIFSEATLAYIGIGLKSPESSIGVLLSSGQTSLLTFPHVIFFPALAICILMLSFNMAGNGLRDAFDPTQRGL